MSCTPTSYSSCAQPFKDWSPSFTDARMRWQFPCVLRQDVCHQTYYVTAAHATALCRVNSKRLEEGGRKGARGEHFGSKRTACAPLKERSCGGARSSDQTVRPSADRSGAHLSRSRQSAVHVKQAEDVSVRREAVWFLHCTLDFSVTGPPTVHKPPHT